MLVAPHTLIQGIKDMNRFMDVHQAVNKEAADGNLGRSLWMPLQTCYSAPHKHAALVAEGWSSDKKTWVKSKKKKKLKESCTEATFQSFVSAFINWTSKDTSYINCRLERFYSKLNIYLKRDSLTVDCCWRISSFKVLRWAKTFLSSLLRNVELHIFFCDSQEKL